MVLTVNIGVKCHKLFFNRTKKGLDSDGMSVGTLFSNL